MHAVIRSYSGEASAELFDLIEQRHEDIEALFRGVEGFVSYVAVRGQDGGMTVTVCEDKAGTDESSRRAAGWVADNMSAPGSPPSITEGEAVVQFSA